VAGSAPGAGHLADLGTGKKEGLTTRASEEGENYTFIRTRFDPFSDSGRMRLVQTGERSIK
jgi:hypothetical protein